MKKNTGFSLLELIIVMAIISILIVISIPSYQIYTRRAHYTEIVEATVPYRIGIEECFEITGDLAECLPGKNGVPEDLTITENEGLLQSIGVRAGGLVVVVPQSKYGILNTDTYELNPTIHQERLIWTTGGGGVAKGYAN